MNKLCIFSESTIENNELIKLYPKAVIKPSIKKGDLISCIDEGYDCIVIIDGAFFWTASVWHKEILFVMEQGIKVVGTASMGALRAAELADFGMIGFGRIYDLYRSGNIIDDSEVAVSFSKTNSNVYSSIPLINLRLSLIDAGLGFDNEIITKLNKIYYRERSWEAIKKRLSAAEFLLLTKHYFDFKRNDALLCLESLDTLLKNHPEKRKQSVPKTFFLKNLITDINYKNDFEFIVENIKKIEFEFSGKDITPAYQSRVSELMKLFDQQKQSFSAKIMGLLINNQLSLKKDLVNEEIKKLRLKLNLLKGDDFKNWCLNKNLLVNNLEKTFEDYLLLKKIIKAQF